MGFVELQIHEVLEPLSDEPKAVERTIVINMGPHIVAVNVEVAFGRIVVSTGG